MFWFRFKEQYIGRDEDYVRIVIFINSRYYDAVLFFTLLQGLAPVFMYVFTVHMDTYFSLSS